MLHCLELRTFGQVDDVPTVFLTDSATAFRHLILHGQRSDNMLGAITACFIEPVA
jgi:hypothetical protein